MEIHLWVDSDGNDGEGFDTADNCSCSGCADGGYAAKRQHETECRETHFSCSRFGNIGTDHYPAFQFPEKRLKEEVMI